MNLRRHNTHLADERRGAFVALVAAGILWGLTVPLSKLALEWLDAGWLTVLRFGLAAPLLLLATRPARLRAALTPRVAVAGAIGFGVVIVLQNAGIARTNVSHASLIVGAVPVLVAAIAAVLGRGSGSRLM
jgi:O-acetylserine/cysteine efflux transporter